MSPYHVALLRRRPIVSAYCFTVLRSYDNWELDVSLPLQVRPSILSPTVPAAARSVPAPSNGAFADESPVDRLVRFGKILTVCTSTLNEGAQLDIPRARKLLDKLADVSK